MVLTIWRYTPKITNVGFINHRVDIRPLSSNSPFICIYHIYLYMCLSVNVSRYILDTNGWINLLRCMVWLKESTGHAWTRTAPPPEPQTCPSRDHGPPTESRPGLTPINHFMMIMIYHDIPWCTMITMCCRYPLVN